MEPIAIKLLGFAAATCTTLAYAPQFVKVWRTRSTEDISLGMFLVMMLGLLATVIVYTISTAGVPGLEGRFARLIAYVKAHGDFFGGVAIGKAAYALLIARLAGRAGR